MSDSCQSYHKCMVSLITVDLGVKLDVCVDSPYQKALRPSGMNIHTLDNLAIMANQTCDLQMAKSA